MLVIYIRYRVQNEDVKIPECLFKIFTIEKFKYIII